jgi:hypothetical protein
MGEATGAEKEVAELRQRLALHQQKEQEIKARTMYDMVTDIAGGRKLLFLTNAQAELLSSTSESLSKMIQELGIPMEGPDAPKLVINLLTSKGFENDLNSHWHPSKPAQRARRAFGDGEERLAEERLVR